MNDTRWRFRMTKLFQSLLNGQRSRRARRSGWRSKIDLTVERLENRTLLSAGALDTTFGVGGKVTTLGFGELQSMVLSDGKIVAVGTPGAAGGDGVGMRYTTSGVLDTTLDGDGIVLADFPGANGPTAGVAVQTDGKVLVTGYGVIGSGEQFVLLRYNSNGTVDGTFGDGSLGIPGLVATGFGDNARAVDVVIQTDGKIVVLGGVLRPSGSIDVALARYHPNGSLDTGFDFDGKATFNFGLNGFDGDGQIVIGPDGKYVAAGYTVDEGPGLARSDFVVARFNTNGTLDTTFGGDGSVTTDFTGGRDQAQDLIVQSDNKVVVVGERHLSGFSTYAMARYNTDGSLDPAFDSDGRVTGESGSTEGFFRGVAIQADNKIVAAGSFFDVTNDLFLLARFNTNGSLDTSFDTDGLVTTNFGAGTQAFGEEIVIQSDGKIVVGGWIVGSGSGFAVARYDAETTAGFTVTPTSGLFTVEDSGSTAEFTVKLDTAPTANVTITLSSSDTGEGTVSPATLTFTPANFSIPQTVTITGVADAIVDGDQPYSIVLAPAVSTDSNYNGVNPPDVSLTNFDVDFPGMAVTQISSQTTESGGTAQFTVKLKSAPTGDVTIPLSSSSPAEGTVSTAQLIFTSANFGTPQTVTVTGVNDSLPDGDQLYSIDLGPTTSSDPDYDQLLEGVFLTNIDDDFLGITVTPTSGLITTEAGGTAQFTVVLNTGITADVTIALSSSNDKEGTVGQATLTFTPANFGTPQTLTITGVDDAVADGNQNYTIVLDAATSADANYNGFNPTDVSVTNTDDDTAAGALDPSFGTNGVVTTFGFGGLDRMVLQSDGKILSVGQPPAADGVGIRYTTTGALDPTFDGDGIVLADFDGQNALTLGVALQSDGRVVVVGYFVVGGEQQFALLRYNADGSLDTNFGDGSSGIPGLVATSFGGFAQATDLVIQSDGKIVVVGWVSGGSSSISLALARYNTDGSLDTDSDGDGTAFGVGGKATFDFGNNNFSGPARVAIDSAGRYVVAGYTQGITADFVLTRINTNGTLDLTLDGDGYVSTDFGGEDKALDLAIHSNGQILLVGSTTDHTSVRVRFAMARYNTDGGLDIGFGSSGQVVDLSPASSALSGTISAAPSNTNFSGVAIQSDAKIIAVGGSGDEPLMARFLYGGGLDPLFGSGGLVQTTIEGSSFAKANDVLIQTDGQIVAGGFVQGSEGGFWLARYESTSTSNTAPVLDNSGTPHVIAPAGTHLPTEMSNGILISDLLLRGGAFGNPITDADSGALEGIALTAINKIDGSFGTWEYTLVVNPQDSDWIDVEAAGLISNSSALLLSADARLRFVTALLPRHNTQRADGTPATPAQGFLPLETKLDTGVTFRAWDQTTGTAGGRADTNISGGTTAFSTATETASTYFETRLFRSFNVAAQLNTYTLEQEFNALVNVFGYQDRSTSDYSGFTVLMSQIPGVATNSLYRMYFGIAFDSPTAGIQTDMGYRYLTTDLNEATIIEGYGPESHRAERDGAYFRELGVNSGTAVLGYIYSTLQPGTSPMSQIYRTDLFDKDTRTGPPGTPATGTVQQQQGDHVYTTKVAFEMTKTPGRQHIEGVQTGWRQEALRGFVRELSPNAGGAAAAARSESVQSATAQTASPAASEIDRVSFLRDDGSVEKLTAQFTTSGSRFALSGSPTISTDSTSVRWLSFTSPQVGRDRIATRTSIAERPGTALRVPLATGAIDRDIGAVDQVWSDVGSSLGNGLRLPWDDE